MIEIIPNFHPIFVHFTVALFSLSVGLFVVTLFMQGELKTQWLTVARWTLWFGAGFTVLTGLSGLDAYNTVAHDTPSHEAMTEHRNWAIATITLFLILTVWSIIRVRRKQVLGTGFVIVMVAAGGLLASTAWHGGEAVYRFGLGVMSLPKAEGEGHAHQHADGAGHGDDGGKGDGHTHSAPTASPTDTKQEDSHANGGHENNGTSSVHPHDDGHDHQH
ncbi:MAG TPA: DUF2231 domain-containing protein [Gammaproteobacteria bacterium]|nr:DUF2231 domain-containing protein [Gammaproteobacteria bacterium]